MILFNVTKTVGIVYWQSEVIVIISGESVYVAVTQFCDFNAIEIHLSNEIIQAESN